MIFAPYIVVISVLSVTLILNFLVANEDSWLGSVGYYIFGDGYIYESVGARFSGYSKSQV